MCDRWLCAAIDVAVNDLVVVPDIATRWFDRKILVQSSVIGFNLLVVQYFGRNACPDLRLTSSRTGSFQ